MHLRAVPPARRRQCHRQVRQRIAHETLPTSAARGAGDAGIRGGSVCPGAEPRESLPGAQAALGSGLGTQVTRTIPPFQGPPAGVKPLTTDMFTSKNFYKDQKSWSDPRYYRCNSPRELVESLWESGRIGVKPPTTASWGDCSIDYPRRNIVSPYPYRTAQEHYEALLAAAKAHGGPTVYTKATTPDWDGFYDRDQKATDQQGLDRS